MRQDEREELEQTNEWLLRSHREGHSEELFYVPSELAKMGVAPKDVVDRLPELRKLREPAPSPQKPPTARGRAAVPVMVVEHNEHERPVTLLGLLDEPEEESETVAEPDTPAIETLVPDYESVTDYDSYGQWEWFGQIEEKFEDEIRNFFDRLSEPEPDLPVFNTMVLPLAQPRVRGRSARMAALPVETPAIKELVSV